MGLTATIPEKFAQRLSARYSLRPPVDVRALLQKYAEVIDARIPISGVDGVCLNLKVPGKQVRVVINASNPPLRRRFTEAHELGHIIIPWHRGTIVDHLDPAHVEASEDYWTCEEEANQFAAELLMPSTWLDEELKAEANLARLHAKISNRCQVSPLAASRRLSSTLPPNVAFVCERGGKVEFSGRTASTLANVPSWGTACDPDLFAYADKHYSAVLGDRRLHWWVLPSRIIATATDPRPWRDILEAIVEDIGVPKEDQKRFKMSVNGVLSAANSAVKHQGRHTKDAVVAACLQRFGDRHELFDIARHPLFMDFVVKRAEELTQ